MCNHVLTRSARVFIGLASGIVLWSCGGGGGGGGDSSAPSSWPTSGSYTLALRVGGSLSATIPSTAVSLVHPSTPQVEYVIDTTAAPSSLGFVLARGNYDSTSARVSAVQSLAYVDSPNGVLRTTSLAATGSRPQQSLGPTLSLCSDSIVALDFSSPYATEVVAATQGADGICQTADDGQVRISFSSSGVPSAAAVSGYIGYLRSPTTGQPTFWMATDSTGGARLVPFGSSGTSTAISSGTPGANVAWLAVQNLSDTILYTVNGALNALHYANGAPVVASVSTLTGPDGWQDAGFDAAASYAYLNSNSGGSGTGTWRVLAVNRSTLSARTLATGSGSIVEASTLPGSVYATVYTAATGNASVLKVNVTTGAQSVFRSSSVSVSAVLYNPAGAHSLLTAYNATGSIPDAALIDDQGATLYSAPSSLMYGIDGAQFDTLSNENLSLGVYFVPISASTFMGGSVLTRYDVASKALRTIGTLPMGSDLGGTAADRVIAMPVLPDPGFAGMFVTRASGAQIVPGGGAVYTFVPGQGNSLVRTTKQVQ